MAIQYVYPSIFVSGIGLFNNSMNLYDQNFNIIYWGGSLSGIDEGIASPNDTDLIYPTEQPFWGVGNFSNGYIDLKYDQVNTTTSGINLEVRVKASGYGYALLTEIYDQDYNSVGLSNYTYFNSNQIQSKTIPISIINKKTDPFYPIVRYKIWTSGSSSPNSSANFYITASDIQISGNSIAPSSTPISILGGVEICQTENVNYIDADESFTNSLTNVYFSYYNDNIYNIGANMFATTTNLTPSSIFNHSLFLINEGSGSVFYSCNSNISGSLYYNTNAWDFNGKRI